MPMELTMKSINNTLLKGRSSLFKQETAKTVRLYPPERRLNVPLVYSDLNECERESLRRRARKMLLPKPSVLRMLFCIPQSGVCTTTVSPAAISLVEYLIEHGTQTPGIFRYEGIRANYAAIAEQLRENRRIRFNEHSILDLASALKWYLRDLLNGLFDYPYIEKILKHCSRGDTNRVVYYSHYLLFSLNNSQMDCFLKLKELFVSIDANSKKNKMSWESICNILSLTLTPQEAFRKIDDVENVVRFFRYLASIDLSSLSVSRYF